jgi:hypothetical protein
MKRLTVTHSSVNVLCIVGARRTPDLWDGHAAERIVDVLERHFHAGSSVSERMKTAPTAYSGSWTSHAQGQ